MVGAVPLFQMNDPVFNNIRCTGAAQVLFGGEYGVKRRRNEEDSQEHKAAFVGWEKGLI